MKTINKSPRTPAIHIFEEADGYHWSLKSIDYFDARGKAYPSKAAARRAAKDHFTARNLLKSL